MTVVIRFVYSFLLLVVVSCGFSHEVDTDISPFIGQEGVQGFNIDNISINSDNALEALSQNEERVFVRTRFTLSRFSNSIVIDVEGRYNDRLDASDISNLASIGLIVPSGDNSLKGQISQLSKNPTATEALAYNIKVNVTLFSDESLSSKVIDLNEAMIYVGGDAQRDGEFFTRVLDRDYYIFHEWDTTQISAVQALPEGNYRKVSLGNTPEFRWDSLVFSTVAPEVNGHPVGYAVYRSGSTDMYKLTNDGSGLLGWNWVNMGDGLSNAYRFIEYPILSGGESTLIGAERNGGLNSDRLFAVMQWDGSQWVETLLGNALKAKVGGTWIDANSYASQVIMSVDNKVWIFVNEFTAPTVNSPLSSNIFLSSQIIILDLVDGGDPTDLNDWNTELHTLDTSRDIGKRTIVNRFHAGVFHQYQDADNFQLYIPGYGLGKVVAQNGSYVYEPIAIIPGEDVFNVGEEFPTGLNSDGLQQVRLCIKAVKSVVNDNIILCQGYSAIYQVDTSDDSVSELIGKNNSAGDIRYSR